MLFKCQINTDTYKNGCLLSTKCLERALKYSHTYFQLLNFFYNHFVLICHFTIISSYFNNISSHFNSIISNFKIIISHFNSINWSHWEDAALFSIHISCTYAQFKSCNCYSRGSSLINIFLVFLSTMSSIIQYTSFRIFSRI